MNNFILKWESVSILPVLTVSSAAEFKIIKKFVIHPYFYSSKS